MHISGLIFVMSEAGTDISVSVFKRGEKYLYLYNQLNIELWH